MELEMRKKTNVLELFEAKDVLNVCAPMVRYSKLEFRSLVRKHGCDLCFTPMIMADSFVQSSKARDNEFTTGLGDTPLVVQFAANAVEDFISAAELVSPFSDGVDLNCGCPQRWAMQDGYGAHLLTQPQTIKDIVSQTRNRIPSPFTVSVKIRIFDDVRKSVQLCQDLEAAGVSFLTVHGRTVKQRGEEVNLDAIKHIVESVGVPVIGNGGIKHLRDAQEMRNRTNCKGTMAAQGILNNPALFTGASSTTREVVQDWLNISLHSGMTFQCFHHHLVFMCEKLLSKEQRRVFNALHTVQEVSDFLALHLDVSIPPESDYESHKIEIQYSDNDGKYFKTRIKEDVDSCDILSESWFCN
ncbi:hypothetical protein GE061_004101 [Apolygus lucorum]|uniref:tRNA-dihydrouridine(20a/20b) synthase [NAD(P)+] n=1 Tax=Apolygus lucorum TaxID=248454 RepID=A0A8S9X0W5_APOLU|nr:hypothetical protein GE061_004101 [Apolygus lucorum]